LVVLSLLVMVGTMRLVRRRRAGQALVGGHVAVVTRAVIASANVGLVSGSLAARLDLHFLSFYLFVSLKLQGVFVC
jgi:hypothetical protein